MRKSIVSFLTALFFLLSISSYAATFQYSDPDCESFSMSQSGGVFVIECVQGGGGGGDGVPSNCSLNASAATIPSTGGSVTLTASCTGTAATTYQFFEDSVALGAAEASGTRQIVLQSNTTGSPISHVYYVRACNDSGCVNTATKTVTIEASGNGGTNYCSGYTVTEQVLQSGQKDVTLTVGKMFVSSFVAGGKGRVALEHYAGGHGVQKVSVSENKCDFTNTVYINEGNSVSIYTYLPPLVRGRTYYVNVTPGKNTSGVQQCTNTNCLISLNIYQPNP